MARSLNVTRERKRGVTKLLCASNNRLEWLNQSEGKGENDFTENYMAFLVPRPTVTLETVH